jgi:hypothetical protein
MVDLQSLEIELRNARKARINAELACCDVEELAAEIRQSVMARLPACLRLPASAVDEPRTVTRRAHI